MRAAAGALLAALLAALVRGDANVSVQWKQLTFEETHELVVTPTVEFILSFAPNPAQGVFPIRVWIKADGGDTSRPLLVTARRRIGAWTWQLPYRSGATVLYELERTLCPDDSVDAEKLNDDCDAEDSTLPASGHFSLHVSSSCAAPTRVQLRASFARDWRLPFESSTPVETQQGAPRVNFYRWLPGQNNVRLVVESADDVCATVAVQNYTCPIAETLEEIEVSTLRMTVMRSGGVQLSRSRYPRGFYVLSVVQDSDEACREEPQPEGDWLWEAAVLDQAQALQEAPPPRRKALTLHTRASLSRAQYVVGAGVTLAVFALFYVLFGALVLAQRWPRWKRLVGPRAVLARKPDEVTRSEVESTMSMSPGRRRRDSTATFDSSDNSDTDEEEDAGTVVTTTATSVASPSGDRRLSAPAATSSAASPDAPDTPDTPDTHAHVTTDTADLPGGDTNTRAVQTEHNGNGHYGVERVQVAQGTNVTSSCAKYCELATVGGLARVTSPRQHTAGGKNVVFQTIKSISLPSFIEICSAFPA